MWDVTHAYGMRFIWDMTDSDESSTIYVRRDSFIWDMTHAYGTLHIHTRHDWFIWDVTHLCKTWLIHIRCDSCIWDIGTHRERTNGDVAPIRDCSVCMTYRITHMRRDLCIWDVTHSHETWLIYMRRALFIEDVTYSNETWLMHMGYWHARRAPTWWRGAYERLLCMYAMNHSRETWLMHMGYDTFIWDMTDSYETHAYGMLARTQSTWVVTWRLATASTCPHRTCCTQLLPVWMSHVILVSESCDRYQWAVSHMW